MRIYARVHVCVCVHGYACKSVRGGLIWRACAAVAANNAPILSTSISAPPADPGVSVGLVAAAAMAAAAGSCEPAVTVWAHDTMCWHMPALGWLKVASTWVRCVCVCVCVYLCVCLCTCVCIFVCVYAVSSSQLYLHRHKAHGAYPAVEKGAGLSLRV